MKLLNTWLEGERSISFCKFLSCKTAMLKPNQIPGSETWPFLISLLIDCTCKEISASKKRVPKLIYAKTLRIVIQRAEDAKGTCFYVWGLSLNPSEKCAPEFFMISSILLIDFSDVFLLVFTFDLWSKEGA
uniref:1-phosphatidylinositol-3-phosphate 5-kinase n=1 Tax=Opuntia streptacantha TaxID=393608 RepID=A0A7C8YZJ2_OPUST